MMKYDPEIGTRYIPSLKVRVTGEKGGCLVRTNIAGFRSEREFLPGRTPKKLRALVFGDSQTAGDGVTNSQRFSDRIESKIPNLEVYNYGVSGTGPDQHFLSYKRHCNVEHDLVIIVVYVENIRRVCRRVIEIQDGSGSPAFYAKPYFEYLDGKLEVRNIPVPKQIWSEQTLPDEYKSYVYSPHETNLFSQVTGRKATAPRVPKALSPLREFAKKFVLQLPSFSMLPEYNDQRSSGWVLLRTILQEWITLSAVPVVLVTIPHYISFVSSRDPTRYRKRFRELADATDCHLYDFLSDLPRSVDDRQQLWSNWSGHLSVSAHELLADRLKPIVQKLLLSCQDARS
ncbi:SGNH/GDSL hydrolase family protein [Methylobacterium sp. J-030]|uniref:SGNH/GDSL hydrolase family protein n=1 Tax=Methylobacterium sp. J-030 TaxID=2836627 RepID=UPI001FBAFAEF|nr:SGNH/GDSL hydrolase family protein [Methylobacterium sp. J-030]MCJ2070908.1 SGNH/GDSL hydrolase family protein [Methylobacterium sp. J-030]